MSIIEDGGLFKVVNIFGQFVHSFVDMDSAFDYIYERS